MRTAATLYDATGPTASVSGENSNARPGTVVVQARLTPSGAQTACVTNGFSPCRSACGHQANAQMKTLGIRTGADILRTGNEKKTKPEGQERECYVERQRADRDPSRSRAIESKPIEAHRRHRTTGNAGGKPLAFQ